MRQNKIKKMVQGAMIAAIFGVLSLLNTYTGSMFDIFICYGMVVPIVWYGYTYDLKGNGIVCLVSLFVIALMGVPFFVISSVSSCLAGMYIGECLKRRLSKGTILLGTFIVMLVNNFCIYEVFSGMLGMNIAEEMTVMYQDLMRLFPQLSTTISLDMFLRMIPIVLIIMSFMETYVVVLLCQLLLSRLNVTFPGQFHVATMHLSKKFGVILAILMLSSFILYRFTEFDSVVFVYVYSLCLIVFMVQGLSFVCFYLILKGYGRWCFLPFLLMFIPFLSSVYVVLGMIDIFSDLRRNLLYNRDNEMRGG